MKIPKRVNVIGSVLTVWYLPTKFRRLSQLDFFTDRHAIAVNSTHTILFGLPISRSKRNSRETKFSIPSANLKQIGTAFKIMWRWNEIDQTLLHSWDQDEPKIYADRKTNPRVIAIKHARGIIFYEEGIT